MIFQEIHSVPVFRQWCVKPLFKKSVVLHFSKAETFACGAHPLYLPRAPEGVHVIEDRDELPVMGRIQDVAVNFQVLHHQIHHVRSQFQGYDVGPVGFSSLQRRSGTLLHLKFAPVLPGKVFTLLAKSIGENRLEH